MTRTRNKYGAIGQHTPDGFFPSRKELRRWRELQLLERIGQISDLKRQVRYPLVVNGVHIAVYVADFVYTRDDNLIVEDVKSPATKKIPTYRMKKSLMFALFGIDILET